MITGVQSASLTGWLITRRRVKPFPWMAVAAAVARWVVATSPSDHADRRQDRFAPGPGGILAHPAALAGLTRSDCSLPPPERHIIFGVAGSSSA
jgi:hypothetical protein